MHTSRRLILGLFAIISIVFVGVVSAASTTLTPFATLDLDADGIADMRLSPGISPACTLGVYSCGDLEMINGSAATSFRAIGTYGSITLSDAVSATYDQTRLFIGGGNGIDKPFIVATSGGKLVKVVNPDWPCCPSPTINYEVLGVVPVGFVVSVETAPLQPPDDRLNWQSGDNIAVVYAEQDSNGNPALHIYDVNENSEGVILLVVELADYADYAENPPAENLLIASGTNVEVYILSTGELQVNIYEVATSKIFVTLYNLTTLEATGGYVLEP